MLFRHTETRLIFFNNARDTAKIPKLFVYYYSKAAYQGLSIR